MNRIFAGLLVLLLALPLPCWAGRGVISSAKGANVYDGPGKKAAKIGKLSKNAELETFEEKQDRVRVRYAGGEGWVAARTVRDLPAAPPPVPAPAPAASAAPAPADQPPIPGAQPVPAPAPEKPLQEGGYLAQALKEEPAARVETGPSLVTVIGALLVVLALVAGGVYLLKLFSGRRYVGNAKGKGIQILASRPLGTRQALLLVEVGGVPLLLAQSEGMVNLIAEIRDPEAVKRLNEVYGFRETPFETALRSRLDLESGEGEAGRGASGLSAGPDSELAGLSPEDRLTALRRRRRPGEDT